MIRLAFCDDEECELNRLSAFLAEYSATCPEELHLTKFQKSDEIMHVIEEGNRFDILILDVEMPGDDGFAIAREAHRMYEKTEVILLTSHEEYGIRAVNSDIRRYVLKRDMMRVLFEVLDDVIRIVAASKIVLYEIVKYNHVHTINLENVEFIHKEGKYAVFHMNNGETISTREPMKDVYNKLDNRTFCFLNSGCIANILYIMNTDGNTAHMRSEKKLVISRGNQNLIKNSIVQYWSVRR